MNILPDASIYIYMSIFIGIILKYFITLFSYITKKFEFLSFFNTYNMSWFIVHESFKEIIAFIYRVRTFIMYTENNIFLNQMYFIFDIRPNKCLFDLNILFVCLHLFDLNVWFV